LPFGLTVAPILCQHVPDGVDISPDRARESVDCVNPGLLSVVEPDVEFLDVFASKNASESHGEPTHGGEVWRCAFQGVDLDRLTGRKQSARLDAERCRDDGRDQPTRRGIDGAGGRQDRRRRQQRGGRMQRDDLGASDASPLRQKPFKMREAAGIAAEFDLVEQGSAANT